MLCKNCNKEHSDTDRFCPFCGKPVPAMPDYGRTKVYQPAKPAAEPKPEAPAQVAAKVETPQAAPVAPKVAKVEAPLKESALQKEATAPGDSTTTTNQSEGKEEKA